MIGKILFQPISKRPELLSMFRAYTSEEGLDYLISEDMVFFVPQDYASSDLFTREWLFDLPAMLSERLGVPQELVFWFPLGPNSDAILVPKTSLPTGRLAEEPPGAAMRKPAPKLYHSAPGARKKVLATHGAGASAARENAEQQRQAHRKRRRAGRAAGLAKARPKTLASD